MNIIEEVKKFVKSECRKPTSKYGFEIFECHFAVVIEHAEELAKKLGGDREVIILAAWLHDIGSIIEGRRDHHTTGAEIAAKKLEELKYPPEKIELVRKCVLNHRGSADLERATLEEKIVAEADAMTAFDSLSGIFKAAFIFEGLNQTEAKDSVRKKLQNKYRHLHFAESRKIIQPKYDAAMLLLK